jgi:hypothetical protein
MKQRIFDSIQNLINLRNIGYNSGSLKIECSLQGDEIHIKGFQAVEIVVGMLPLLSPMIISGYDIKSSETVSLTIARVWLT